jgi:F5/8 type C domain/Exo-beta-D-glucosaminidase Ig-fold domain/Glycosyl hydrolases family 2/Glycosyl hydrolases family 2, sugar binding domain/Glycosyl hydrolases family 2, TIM barrel domain
MITKKTYYAVALFLGVLLSNCSSKQQVTGSPQSLDSGSPLVNWQVKPQAEVGKDSIKLFDADFSQSGWVNATVPGIVFNDYVNAGLEKDPNFGDNIYKVDKDKYDRNYWYKTTLKIPENYKSGKLWLNFEGINRKADVFLNGKKLGHLDGFMDRGMFDITDIASKDKPNTLAVLVYWPVKPIPNFASPTYISSASWDWMPYVPGLLMGITDNVYLTNSGDVTIQDPWIRTKVPTKTTAYISVQTELVNHSAEKISGVLKGMITPGNIEFSIPVEIDAGETKTVSIDKSANAQLHIENPKLWWPNGYGDASLYKCTFQFVAGATVSDQVEKTFGIREYKYETSNNMMHFYVNGERIFLKGGSWGMSEYLLKCRGSEYDIKLRLHKEMNFNIIRNWIGSTTDEEFYDACDKYGVMVWDDFWLNSHKNLPRDVDVFNENAIEKIKRLRNHPSIALWCGDNESSPEPPLNDMLREDVAKYDGNDRRYQPNSRKEGGFSGSGPWANFSPQTYFSGLAGFEGDPDTVKGMRSEVGTAVFTTFESFKKFMPQENWWPRNDMWDKHFFGPSAGNGGPDQYEKTINESYGQAKGIKDFTQKAQLLNIETNKAMYEGWRHTQWDDATGVLTWMSQSAYPSFVWQTYDYYYDLNGAYWGAKAGSEPLHIQWSAADNTINVVNGTLNGYNNLTATVAIYDMKGQAYENFAQTAKVNAPANKSVTALKLNFNVNNLANGKKVTASSSSKDAKAADIVTDGSAGTRWSSNYNDNEWIYVDLGAPTEINTIRLLWESAYGKAYKVLVSTDAKTWKELYSTDKGDGGTDEITFKPMATRYIKMQGLKRASQWGYSLYEIEAYNIKPAANEKDKLPPVHFIKLKLTDANGKLLSENFYWRGEKSLDYTALTTLEKVNLTVEKRVEEKDGKYFVIAKITNPANSKMLAFATDVKLVNSKTAEQYLPTFKTDSYFSLLPGESKEVTLEVAKDILNGDTPVLVIEPYNNTKE